TETGAGLGNPFVVGDHEHTRHALHSSRCLDAALDQWFGRAARSLEFDQRLSRIARRLIARRDQDHGIHRGGGQSWMWSTPTGLGPRPSSSTTNKAVILYSSNKVSASSTRASGPTVFGLRVMNSAAV